ncbi:MAG TPA: MlaD family protein [Candidatus Sulfotelmatobacter sp.]|nr:MlaD family protein [Candidatus Sulfotelmatobacter sp.]
MSEQESRVQLRVGIFVLAAIILFVAFVLTIGSQTRVFEGRYALRASFNAIEGLIVGAPVRLAGLSVGHVAHIGFGRDPGDRRLVVDLSIDRRYQDKIREDSVATISTIGLVGDKYVEITVGNPDRKVLEPLAFVHSVDPLDYGRLFKEGAQAMTGVSKLSAALEEFFAGPSAAETRRNLVALIGSLRATLAQVEQDGLVEQLTQAAGSARKAGDALARAAGTTDAALADAQGLLREVKEGKGLLHALVYDPEGGATLARLASALGALDDVARELKEGKGLLHALVYDPEGGAILARLARAGQALEDLARAAKEGPGLLHALIADPKGANLVADLAGAAADLKRVTGKLARGEGTLGALLDDPTLYEDLSTLLRGAERSWILRTVIRSGLRQGEDTQR